MCGRYPSTRDKTKLSSTFKARWDGPWPTPNYNAAPTQMLPVVRYNPATKERVASLLRWGLVPQWAKDLSIGSKMINARAETVHEKPGFKKAFAKRRCLVPTDGYYEWKTTPDRAGVKTKTPYYISPVDGGTFAFAGLWEGWRHPDTQEVVRTFCIMTTVPNPVLAEIHDRMPAILRPEDWATWLGEEEAAEDQLLDLCRSSYPSQLMKWWPVSTLVNSVRNEGAELIEPVAAS